MTPTKAKLSVRHDEANRWFLDITTDNGTKHTLPLRESDAIMLKQKGIIEKPPISTSKEVNRIV